MDPKRIKRISKTMSHALRHRPDLYGLEPDRQGWCRVEQLLEAFGQRGIELSYAQLETVVAKNDKQRFSFSADGQLIRANQGHSIEVELGYAPVTPPEYLYHGTAEKNVASIKEQGLHRRNRHHVHLSPDRETATRVGERHGRPVVLTIRAADMHRAGHLFYRSENGVWLTDAVPTEFILATNWFEKI